MLVSREDVVAAYRLILGRAPESEEAIQSKLHFSSTDALIAALLRSVEFQESGLLKDVLQVLPEQPRKPSLLRRLKPQAQRPVRVSIFGNCQAEGVGAAMGALSATVEVSTLMLTPELVQQILGGSVNLDARIADADLICMQPFAQLRDWVVAHYPRAAKRIRSFPALASSAFHPDCVTASTSSGRPILSPLDYHSSIALWGWRAGWTEHQVVALFREEVYFALGFFQYMESSNRALIDQGHAIGFPLDDLLRGWNARGSWLHTINHPKIHALVDVAAELLRAEGIDVNREAAAWADDRLQRAVVWPVYPEIAQRVQAEGSLLFKISSARCSLDRPIQTLDLEEMVAASFRSYRELKPSEVRCRRFEDPRYQELARFVSASPRSAMTRLRDAVLGGIAAPEQTSSGAVGAPAAVRARNWGGGEHPYRGIPRAQLWRDAVGQAAPHEIDLVQSPRFTISAEEPVMTAGSCFAQHIARVLRREGLNHLVTEPTPSADAEVVATNTQNPADASLYSARYGNIYTARQLKQLLGRAFGAFVPLENAWQRADGRWVDPFRPNIDAAGFESPEAVAADRVLHLQAVRRAFEQASVLVFTLGLTECWVGRSDGAAYPLAPGVVAGSYDPAEFEFVNFGVGDVVADLRATLKSLREVNPSLKVLLTVSPVPLAATYEPRHVVVSTTESKAVLRAAAREVVRAEAGVDYFPSFEMITATHTRGAYFEPDLRSVAQAGVDHVMALFLKHYLSNAPTVPVGETPSSSSAVEADFARQYEEAKGVFQVLCDEDTLVARV